MNRQFLLRRRPQGLVTRDDFEYRESEMPKPGEGEALVQNLLLSFDPSQRIWMSELPGYMPPIGLGEVMRSDGIGRVVESNDPKLPVGSLVQGLVGWQDYCVTKKGTPYGFFRMPELSVPPEMMLSALGMTGITAYFGMKEIGAPKPGETVVVSAASGAVGSIAGQIAKIEGARVIGLAGSADKCAWLTGELGFDVAINYKDEDWKKQLRAACPKGIDVDFENAGGAIMHTVFSLLNLHARVALCGLIASYNSTGDRSASSAELSAFIVKRIRLEGFLVLDYAKRFGEAVQQLGAWLAAGKLKHKETVVEGLENAPDTLNRLFDGEKLGKLLLRIAT